jgi:hypothetical protein
MKGRAPLISPPHRRLYVLSFDDKGGFTHTVHDDVLVLDIQGAFVAD